MELKRKELIDVEFVGWLLLNRVHVLNTLIQCEKDFYKSINSAPIERENVIENKGEERKCQYTKSGCKYTSTQELYRNCYRCMDFF